MKSRKNFGRFSNACAELGEANCLKEKNGGKEENNVAVFASQVKHGGSGKLFSSTLNNV